jgi:hypothetical protein
MSFRAGSPFSSDDNELIDNLRLGGALRWKGVTAGWEGWGVVCRKPTHLRL